jgi:hypothetical protein
MRRLILLGLLAVSLVAAAPAQAAPTCHRAPKMAQSEVLHCLGYPTDKASILRLEGNGRLQQLLNQQAALQGLPQPFNPSFASSLIQDLIPLAAIVGVGAAAGAAGGAAKGVASSALDGTSSEPADSPASVFRTSALAAGAAFFAGSVAHLVSSSQAVDLRAGWFQSIWGRIVGLGAVLFAGLGLLVTLLVATPRGDAAMVGDGLRGVGEAVAITFGAVAVVGLALAGTDELSAAIGGSDLNAAGTMMKVFAGLLAGLALAAKSPLSHVGPFATLLGTPAWLVAGGALLGTGLTLLDLFFRNIAIYLAMAFLPLAAATRTFPALKGWSRKLMRFLAAVIVSKLVLVIAISLAAAMVLHGGLSGLLYGTALALVCALVPFMLYGLVGLVEHLAFHGRKAAGAATGVVAAQGARETMRQRRREIELMEQAYSQRPPAGWGPDGPASQHEAEPSIVWEHTSSPTRQFGLRRPRPAT